MSERRRPVNSTGQAVLDAERMRELVRWTAKTLATAQPMAFGAEILRTRTGERLMRAVNTAGKDNDPSAHAELRAVRLACRKLKSTWLAGYTLYTTCEPCPMCMANALWAGLDRVVFGVTIEDASRFCRQVRIPATEVAEHADAPASSDAPCIVEGPVERNVCLELFMHPAMQKVFRSWNAPQRQRTR